jgi:hypothetical protein
LRQWFGQTARSATAARSNYSPLDWPSQIAEGAKADAETEGALGLAMRLVGLLSGVCYIVGRERRHIQSPGVFVKGKFQPTDMAPIEHADPRVVLS